MFHINKYSNSYTSTKRNYSNILQQAPFPEDTSPAPHSINSDEIEFERFSVPDIPRKRCDAARKYAISPAHTSGNNLSSCNLLPPGVPRGKFGCVRIIPKNHFSLGLLAGHVRRGKQQQLGPIKNILCKKWRSFFSVWF